MNIVILAGGGGTRLWPMSRKNRPKQFQKLIGDQTLLELTRQRLDSIVPAGNIYYSVTKETADEVRRLLPDVANDHIFVEPERRDTGPAVGFVIAKMEQIAPDEPVMFMWSDHYIADVEKFGMCIQLAGDVVKEKGVMVNIGIVPEWANPELGYVHVGEKVSSEDDIDVMEFRAFIEKPSKEDAEAMIETGEYLWNAAYFTWTPTKFMEAFHHHHKEAYDQLREMQKLWKDGKDGDVPALYAQMEKISIDNAVIKKLKPEQVLTIKAPFLWSDVGLWGALKKLREENPDDNVTEGSDHTSIDTADTLIYGPKGKVIATIGLQDVVIVDTPDALLICAKDQSDKVKKIVEKLKEQGLDQYL